MVRPHVCIPLGSHLHLPTQTRCQKGSLDDTESRLGTGNNRPASQRGMRDGRRYVRGESSCEGRSGARAKDPFSLSPFRFVDHQVRKNQASVKSHADRYMSRIGINFSMWCRAQLLSRLWAYRPKPATRKRCRSQCSTQRRRRSLSVEIIIWHPGGWQLATPRA